MNTFTSTSLNVLSMSQNELNAIALKGGVVGSIGFGYSVREPILQTRFGFGFRWIKTKGMGNHGTLVLLAKSATTAELLRQGKILELMDKLSITYQEADALYSASVGVQRGREPAVLAYCASTITFTEAWKRAPSATWKDRLRWEQEWDMPHSALSCPRWTAVLAIMAKLIK